MGEDWLGQKIDLTLWSDEISFVMWVTTALDAVAFFVTAVLAIIIIGGIMNAMWMSVRERTKEIGTMRAIGTQKGFIGWLFVAEAILLGFFAAGIGVIFGVILLTTLNALHLPLTNDGIRLFLMSNVLSIKLHPGEVITTLFLFSGLTGLAALYPAISAARLRPVEALMHSK
jgi:ABC-type lipoprotein release transport system permease subunit